MNKVTSPFRAIIDGNETALSGCSNTECKYDCLRKDKQLKSVSMHNRNNEKYCGAFIAIRSI